MLGIATCAAINLKTYDPAILAEKDPATNTAYLRFDFTQPFDHEHNHAIILKISEMVRLHGATHVPGAAGAIAAISESDLLKRVQTKYKLMRKEWRGRQSLISAVEDLATAKATAERNEEGWSEDDITKHVESNKNVKSMAKKIRLGASAPKLQSRASGVRTLT